jgi:DNA-binding NarL/FixJ family response regulator
MSTTKTHVGRLLTKLAARDRAQLVIAAYDTGLVRPSSARPTG